MVEAEEAEAVEEVEAEAEVTLQTPANPLKILTMENPADHWENQRTSPQTGTLGVVEPHEQEPRQSQPQREKTHSPR